MVHSLPTEGGMATGQAELVHKKYFKKLEHIAYMR